LDFALQIGGHETIVEVRGEAPLVDLTTNHTMTNVTEDMINNAPHGLSFQSMIQFAPMARRTSCQFVHRWLPRGNGGPLPGSSGNGGAGLPNWRCSDSESAYLVEGRTPNISGGYSSANAFEFIQKFK
jgi:hypothetical protein